MKRCSAAACSPAKRLLAASAASAQAAIDRERIRARHIGLHWRRGSAEVCYIACGSLGARPVKIGNREIGTKPRELQRNCAADTSSRARDNRHLIGELQGHHPSHVNVVHLPETDQCVEMYRQTLTANGLIADY